MRVPRFAALATVAVLVLAPRAVLAQAAALPQARNVLLVQDGFTDRSAWASVIALLEAAGLRVTEVESPETQRVLALQDGTTVLVGQGWSGATVSAVGVENKVSALVYVAAVAPEAGEDFKALSARFPTQKSSDAAVRSIETKAAAWRDKPSFYAVAQESAALVPELQRFYASRMKAKTILLDSVAAHPREIAGLILEASGMKPVACDATGDDGENGLRGAGAAAFAGGGVQVRERVAGGSDGALKARSAFALDLSPRMACGVTAASTTSLALPQS